MKRLILIGNIFGLSILYGCSTQPLSQSQERLTYIERSINRKDFSGAFNIMISTIAADPEIVNSEKITNILKMHPDLLTIGTASLNAQTYRNILTSAGRKAANEHFSDSTKTLVELKKPNEGAIVSGLLKKFSTMSELDLLEYIERTDEIAETRAAAIHICTEELECKNAFSLTQAFITERSSMKIRFANDTVIDTYNPTTSLDLGFQAIKKPQPNGTQSIEIKGICQTPRSAICTEKEIEAIKTFKQYINSHQKIKQSQ